MSKKNRKSLKRDVPVLPFHFLLHAAMYLKTPSPKDASSSRGGGRSSSRLYIESRFTVFFAVVRLPKSKSPVDIAGRSVLDRLQPMAKNGGACEHVSEAHTQRRAWSLKDEREI